MYSNSCLPKMKMIFMQYLFSLKLVLFYVLPSNNNNNNNRLDFSWGNHNLSILVFLIDTISIKMWQRLLDRPSFGHWRRRRAPTIFYYQYYKNKSILEEEEEEKKQRHGAHFWWNHHQKSVIACQITDHLTPIYKVGDSDDINHKVS